MNGTKHWFRLSGRRVWSRGAGRPSVDGGCSRRVRIGGSDPRGQDHHLSEFTEDFNRTARTVPPTKPVLVRAELSGHRDFLEKNSAFLVLVGRKAVVYTTIFVVLTIKITTWSKAKKIQLHSVVKGKGHVSKQWMGGGLVESKILKRQTSKRQQPWGRR